MKEIDIVLQYLPPHRREIIKKEIFGVLYKRLIEKECIDNAFYGFARNQMLYDCIEILENLFSQKGLEIKKRSKIHLWSEIKTEE